MARISKSSLDRKTLDDLKRHFSFLISSLSKPEDIEEFFEEFLTKEEKLMLTKRLILFMMIKKGFPPSTIKSLIRVSYETVRTYQNLFEHKSSRFNQIIERLLKRDETNKFFKKIEKILKPIDLALKSRSDMKARAKFASGDWS